MTGPTQGTAQRDAKGLRCEQRRLARMREGNPRREHERNHRRKRPPLLAARTGLVEPIGCGAGRERLCNLCVAGRRRGRRAQTFEPGCVFGALKGWKDRATSGSASSFFTRAPDAAGASPPGSFVHGEPRNASGTRAPRSEVRDLPAR